MTSEELKKLLDAATPGPWTYTKCQCGSPYCHQYVMSNQGSVGLSEHDARLTALAPELATEVIRLRALLDNRPADNEAIGVEYGRWNQEVYVSDARAALNETQERNDV